MKAAVSGGVDPVAAPRTNAVGEDRPAVPFSDSLRDAGVRANDSGDGTGVDEAKGGHTAHKATERDDQEQPRQTGLASAAAMPISLPTQPEPLVLAPIAIAEKDLENFSAANVETAAPSAAVNAQAADASSAPDSIASTLLPDGGQSSDSSATSQLSASNPAAQRDLSLTLPMPDSTAAVPAADGSVLSSGGPAGGSSPTGTQLAAKQVPVTDFADDPILSSIRAAIFASSPKIAATPAFSAPALGSASSNTQTTLAGLHVQSSARALTGAGVSQSTVLPSSAPSFLPQGVIAQASTTQESTAKTGNTSESQNLSRGNVPSSSGALSPKKIATSARTSAKEDGKGLAAPVKNEDGEASDPDAAQPIDAIAAESTHETAVSQSHATAASALGSDVIGTLSQGAIPALQIAMTPASGVQAALSGNETKPPAFTQPDAQTAISTPATDGTLALNTVRLLQRAGQAEMTIGMHSAEFGSISIRTLNVRDQIAAEVSVDHAELTKALLSHLPELQSGSNGDRPLDLQITNTSAATGGYTQSSASGDTSQGGGRRSPPNQMGHNFTGSQMAQPLALNATESMRTSLSNNRLDVRA